MTSKWVTRWPKPIRCGPLPPEGSGDAKRRTGCSCLPWTMNSCCDITILPIACVCVCERERERERESAVKQQQSGASVCRASWIRATLLFQHASTYVSIRQQIPLRPIATTPVQRPSMISMAMLSMWLLFYYCFTTCALLPALSYLCCYYYCSRYLPIATTHKQDFKRCWPHAWHPL